MSRSVEELEQALAAATRRAVELQAWIDDAEQETEPLRERAHAAEVEVERLKQRFAVLDALGEGPLLATENRKLVERVSELEACNHSLRALSTQLVTQAEAAGERTVAQLSAQLEAARADQSSGRADELEAALLVSREAMATLQVQRESALQQVRHYVGEDARTLQEHDAKAQAEIENLTEQLAEKVDQTAVLNQRLHAHIAEEEKLALELTALRERACKAEESLGQAQTEAGLLREGQVLADTRFRAMAEQLKEARQEAADTAELNRALATTTLERSVMSAAPAAANTVMMLQPPPPPEEATRGQGLEGYSPQHIHQLEAMLAAERLKSRVLQDFAATCEKSLVRVQDELTAAGGRMADLGKLLQNAGGETGEVSERLEAARRELHALKHELTLAMSAELTPGGNEELIDPDDVLEAPLTELDAMAAGQGEAVREVALALAGEQRAREELLGDLSWLKLELEKLTNVREDLRSRVRAMVHRELNRKQVMGMLLAKLRTTEVAAAARAGSLRRLHAALELAQARAARVQTIYFQKQIGSLQRQLESALKKRTR